MLARLIDYSKQATSRVSLVGTIFRRKRTYTGRMMTRIQDSSSTVAAVLLVLLSQILSCQARPQSVRPPPELSLETGSSRTSSSSSRPRHDPFFATPLTTPLTKPQTTLHRILNQQGDDDNSNDQESYFTDPKTGQAYEPYSLAWRYLGMYMDCDVTTVGAGSYYRSDDDDTTTTQLYADNDDRWNDDDDIDIDNLKQWYRRRRRNLGSQDEDGGDCTRKVLWAAYRDPHYKGNSIGEYQYYNVTSGDYSKDYCQGNNKVWPNRCVRMDCHEPNTHFQLVGVYKEADGLMDWAEQLFKHQGYCLWADQAAMGSNNEWEEEQQEGSGDGDNHNNNDETYEFMESYREWWPSYCRQLYYTAYDGSTLYMDLKPQAEGNISVGIYSDDLCATPSGYTFGDYIMMYYSYYGYQDKGQQVVETWETAINQWNDYMSVYKICQPCRAYSLQKSAAGDANSGSGDNNNNRYRFLEENDGDGEEEQWGYNCYDDAGYTNCDQCYKFETQTDLALVDEEDLKFASRQGSILAIKVNGTTYGKGGVRGPPKITVQGVAMTAFVGLAITAAALTVMYLMKKVPLTRILGTVLYWIKEKWSNWGRKPTELVREHYHIEDDKYIPPPPGTMIVHPKSSFASADAFDDHSDIMTSNASASSSESIGAKLDSTCIKAISLLTGNIVDPAEPITDMQEQDHAETLATVREDNSQVSATEKQKGWQGTTDTEEESQDKAFHAILDTNESFKKEVTLTEDDTTALESRVAGMSGDQIRALPREEFQELFTELGEELDNTDASESVDDHSVESNHEIV